MICHHPSLSSDTKHVARPKRGFSNGCLPTNLQIQNNDLPLAQKNNIKSCKIYHILHNYSCVMRQIKCIHLICQLNFCELNFGEPSSHIFPVNF